METAPQFIAALGAILLIIAKYVAETTKVRKVQSPFEDQVLSDRSL
jgi:hypothetical protein